MKICVVGGAGYIGSHTVKLLIECGHSVVVVDNLRTGCRTSIHRGADFVHCNVGDRENMRAALNGCDSVIYLAALKAAGESMSHPGLYTKSNIAEASMFIDLCAEVGIQRFVFSSTAAVYGSPEYLPIDESHPTNPENFYGFTKLKIEELLEWYVKLKGMKAACLRYFNAAGYSLDGSLYGLEMEPSNLIPVIMEVACGIRGEMKIFGGDYPTRDGTCIRDYIHVWDLARAHLNALERLDYCPLIKVNLGTGYGSTVLEVIRATERITQRVIKFKIIERRIGDPSEVWATSALAKKLLSWEAEHSSLDVILSSTWSAYQHNGLC